MKIQFNTDRNIEGNQRLETWVTKRLHEALDRFAERITRIEVHMSDQNGQKNGQDDQQCRLEARLKGLNPITVTAREATIEKSFSAAISKLRANLDTTIGKMTEIKP
jgi:hypothetical protein